MSTRSTRRRGRLSVTAVALAMGWVGVGVPTFAADQPAASPRACLIVDTDAGLDDYRALAILLPQRDVRAVVVTEGISSVQGGSTALSMFLASRGQTPPVIPGLASEAPPAYDWLPAVRAGAERMNNFLHAAVPFGGNPNRLTRDVSAAVRGCAKIDLLALGPWTSYLRYAPALGPNVHVVASGRSFAENNPDNFNCEYDVSACRNAFAVLARGRGTVFVDLPPAGAELTYTPTEAMVAQFDHAGMPGLLRAALQVDPTQWLDTRLWDDAAALYLGTPQNFTPQDQHLIPAIPENQFRAQVISAINAN
jgi:inosine-uridine nucleoside N-ribohydrolase